MTKDMFKTQKDSFFVDKNIATRVHILTNLWNAHEVFPEATALVEVAAEEDPAAEVRKAAREIMVQNPNEFTSQMHSSQISSIARVLFAVS